MSSLDRGALEGLKIDREPAGPSRAFPWGKVLLLLAVVAAGIWWWVQRPGIPEVQTLTVRSRVMSADSGTGAQTLLNASGYVTARRAATVSAKVTGKVMDVLVEEGMKIEEGEVVGRLDDSNFQASLHLAEARLEAARLIHLETAPALTFARLELERFVQLRTSNAASLSDLARAESEVATLRARQLRQEADIRVAERQVDEWSQQVEDTIVRAPFAGVVTTKDAQPGEIISPMASGGFTRTGICTVVDMSSLEIEVDVSESYLNRVRTGQPAEALLDAYPEWRIPCKVIAIIPTADRQKATVKVRVGFESLDPKILPEMGVKVAFHALEEKNLVPVAATPVLLIPDDSLNEDNGSTTVWVFQNDRAERRAIRTGRSRGGETEVAAGLAAGEKIILNAPSNLTDGAPVRESKS